MFNYKIFYYGTSIYQGTDSFIADSEWNFGDIRFNLRFSLRENQKKSGGIL